MSERLAVDANAVIELYRSGVPPPPMTESKTILLPLPVVGELFTGAHFSKKTKANLALVEETIDSWEILIPDIQTARVYGEMRSQLRLVQNTKQSRINDLWIAALCLQHNLPLLTNDSGFDVIPNLTVIHW